MDKLFVFIYLILFLSSCGGDAPTKLPILGNSDLIYKTVHGKTTVDTIYQSIPPFSYLNEDSNLVTNKSFQNKIWVVEFFFATCPTICPIMNVQLQRLNKETKKLQKHIQFISFSINPKNDTPSVLSKYKKDQQITAANWTFLSGNEEETHRIAIENFLTFANRDEEAAGGYAHSGSFTLVDKEGHVRGVYAVINLDLSVNTKEYSRLKTDINNLLTFEYHVN